MIIYICKSISLIGERIIKSLMNKFTGSGDNKNVSAFLLVVELTKKQSLDIRRLLYERRIK